MQDFVFNCTPDAAKLTIREYGKHQWWREAVFWVAELVCELSGHRLCNSLVMWGFKVAFGNVKAELSVPVDRSVWLEWAKATGREDPSWWWEDDDE